MAQLGKPACSINPSCRPPGSARTAASPGSSQGQKWERAPGAQKSHLAALPLPHRLPWGWVQHRCITEPALPGARHPYPPAPQSKGTAGPLGLRPTRTGCSQDRARCLPTWVSPTPPQSTPAALYLSPLPSHNPVQIPAAQTGTPAMPPPPVPSPTEQTGCGPSALGPAMGGPL